LRDRNGTRPRVYAAPPQAWLTEVGGTGAASGMGCQAASIGTLRA